VSSSIDQQFVEYVVKSLVSKPDAVVVERRIDEKGVLLELTVDPEDLGRVIGKRGATAQSVRTLLRALGTKNDARYNLKIVDNGPPKPEKTESPKPLEDSSLPAEEDKSPNEGVWGEDEPQQQEQASDNGDADTSEEAEEDKKQEQSSGSETLAKTRKELDDLDDLDV